MTSTYDRVLAAFAAAFGGAPDVIARAPGRVNLIGEHTDYNEGFVLPAAISGHSLVAVRRRADRHVHVVAADIDHARDAFALDAPPARAALGWADYVRGMVHVMAHSGCPLGGVDMAIAGDVPRGAGLSSSASLTVAIGTALQHAFALDGVDATVIAQWAQAAECTFVGTRCGIMDQLVSARGVAGHALLIDCRSLSCRPVPLPPDMAILIVHSGVERGLVEGAYNDRRAQCEAAAQALGVAALRDADLAQLTAQADQLDPIVLRRARHVISENARTLAAAKALAAADVQQLGALMAASHASMRDDFEISVPAVDQLVALLQSAIGPWGGARMTGGGFGGAVVALVSHGHVDHVIHQVQHGYRTPQGASPLILVERPTQGANLYR